MNISRRFRDPISGLSHLFTAVFAVFGLVALLIFGWGQTGKTISLLIYGLSLMLMFSASAAYHLYNGSPQGIQLLRKLDHTAIYLLIAGTYTPISYNLFGGFWQWGLLLIIWLLALAGIITKLFVIDAPRWLTAGLYLCMGWLAILGLREMIISLPPGGLTWLLLGGAFYTLGAVIYITKTFDLYPGVFGFHEVWHIFVILGALSHYILILIYVALPGGG
ncbi:MAG: hemolysin III family protein [Anaerolineales bacterium]|nr:hemolysin III family protein [Anaerolineales bacterium]